MEICQCFKISQHYNRWLWRCSQVQLTYIEIAQAVIHIHLSKNVLYSTKLYYESLITSLLKGLSKLIVFARGSTSLQASSLQYSIHSIPLRRPYLSSVTKIWSSSSKCFRPFLWTLCMKRHEAEPFIEHEQFYEH